MMKNFSIAPSSTLAADAPPATRDARPACLTSRSCTSKNENPAQFGATLSNGQIGASPEEIKDWLRLCHTPGVPPAAVRRLLAAFGPPNAIFAASRGALSDVVPVDVVGRLLARTSAELSTQIAATLEWASRPGCAVVTLSETAYPRALLTLGDPPPILYCRGDGTLANRSEDDGERAVAIVGSRRASPQGCGNARHFARVLGDAGVTVVSGLAAGIDAAAHEGALETPGGTCAVIGTGADIVYPTRHRALAEQIAERGLMLSAFPIGTPPRPEHFPRRNRLIAALARCTVVIEATTHSGSLITARLAGELGRDVLAVPGSIHSPHSQGCHVLIRDGATLVTSPDDVLEALGMTPSAPDHGRRIAQGSNDGNLPPVPDVHVNLKRTKANVKTVGARDAPAGTTAVLKALGYDPVNADTLCERTGLGIADVLAQLGALELGGHVARLPGGRFSRLTLAD
ncbi:DNA-processing protein DprA [Pandoraea sputorum]|uniref:DNA-processing protein DprA n=1 Tax=Pandoraea sputorum TaxID=93222 RepID=UPI001E5E7512|nr:DNA-processing protein DprA [Pandoraea sputorum]MCE4061196.1 DNA-processing protein DprA [Pandoraea sputorum]